MLKEEMDMESVVTAKSVDSALRLKNIPIKLSQWWKSRFVKKSALKETPNEYAGLSSLSFAEKYAAFKREADKIEFNAAQQIQAMVRGSLCRMHLASVDMLPGLSLACEVSNDNEIMDDSAIQPSEVASSNMLSITSESQNLGRMPAGMARNLTVVTDGSLKKKEIGAVEQPSPKIPVLSGILNTVHGGIRSLGRHIKVMKTDLKATASDHTKVAGSVLSNAIQDIKESTSGYIAKKVQEKDMSSRRLEHIGGMVDAMLLLSDGCGSVVARNIDDEYGETHKNPQQYDNDHVAIASALISSSTFFPVIHRKWYIVSYPHIRKPNGLGSVHENSLPDAVLYMRLHGYPDKNSRLNSECVRTPLKYPFSFETLREATSTMHLTDYYRHDYVEYIIYMEAAFDPHNANDRAAHAGSYMDEIGGNLASAEARRHYVPVFQGSCQLAMHYENIDSNSDEMTRLPVFPPYGGRLYMLLTPNVFEISNLASQNVAKSLISIEKLSFTVTLVPVACPSSSFLHTFVGYKQRPQASTATGAASLWCNAFGNPLPAAPHTHLVDCELLEPAAFKYNHNVYGAVLHTVGFRNRFMISTRHNNVYSGVFEYSTEGILNDILLDTENSPVLHDTATRVSMTRIRNGKHSLGAGRYVSLLLSSSRHLAACMDNGAIVVFFCKEKKTAGVDVLGNYTKSSPEKSTPRSCMWNEYDFEWSTPIYMTDYHHQAITVGCQTTEAGNMDIFYTVDRSGYFVISILNDGALVRTFTSPPMSHVPIQSIEVFDNKMYIALKSGSISICDLTSFYAGSVATASGTSIHKHLLYVQDYGYVFEDYFSPRTEYDQFGNEIYDSGGVSSLWSMCVMAPNSIINHICTEDDVRKVQEESILDTHHASKRNYRNMSRPSDGSVKDNGSKAGFKTMNNSSQNNHIVEGHLLLVGGGDKDPRVKVLRPIFYYHKFEEYPESSMCCIFHEVASLEGHAHAITQIVADVAGRHIITASSGDQSVRLWDGLTFCCYHKFENIGVSNISLAYNALLISSYKPPYLRLYRVYYKEPVSKAITAKRKVRENNENLVRTLSSGKNLKAVSTAGLQHQLIGQLLLHAKELHQEPIQTRRSVQWCYSLLSNSLQLSPKLLLASENSAHKRSHDEIGSGKARNVEASTGKHISALMSQLYNPNQDNYALPTYPFTSFEREEYEVDVSRQSTLWKSLYGRNNASENDKMLYVGSKVGSTVEEASREKKHHAFANLLTSKLTPKKSNSNGGGRTPRSLNKLAAAAKSYQQMRNSHMNQGLPAMTERSNSGNESEDSIHGIDFRDCHDDSIFDMGNEQQGRFTPIISIYAQSRPEVEDAVTGNNHSFQNNPQNKKNDNLGKHSKVKTKKLQSIRDAKDLLRYSDGEDSLEEQEENHLKNELFNLDTKKRNLLRKLQKPVLDLDTYEEVDNDVSECLIKTKKPQEYEKRTYKRHLELESESEEELETVLYKGNTAVRTKQRVSKKANRSKTNKKHIKEENASQSQHHGSACGTFVDNEVASPDFTSNVNSFEISTTKPTYINRLQKQYSQLEDMEESKDLFEGDIGGHENSVDKNDGLDFDFSHTKRAPGAFF